MTTPGRMPPGGVAIYWDFENMHLSAAKLCAAAGGAAGACYTGGRVVDMDAVVAVARALGHGRVDVNRAYANWAAFGTPYAGVLNRHAVQLVQLFYRGPNSKNGADIALAMDVAEDIARFPHLHTVVLVGGDSDYIAVAQHVHARGKRVVGVGVRATTNKFWALACDDFYWYDDLVLQRPGVVPPAKRGVKAVGAAKEGVTPEEGPTPANGHGREGVREAAAAAAPRPASEPAAVPKDPLIETRVRGLLCRAILSEMETTKLPYARKASLKPRMARLDDPADPVFGRETSFYTGFKEWLNDLCGDVVISSQGASGLPELRLAPGAAERLGVATKGKGKATAVAKGPVVPPSSPAASSAPRTGGGPSPVVSSPATAGLPHEVDLHGGASLDAEAPVNGEATVTNERPSDADALVNGKDSVANGLPVTDEAPATDEVPMTNEALLDDGQCSPPGAAAVAAVAVASAARPATASATAGAADSGESPGDPGAQRRPGGRSEPASPPPWHGGAGSSDGTPEEPHLSIVDAAWLDRIDGDESGSDGGERRFILLPPPSTAGDE